MKVCKDPNLENFRILLVLELGPARQATAQSIATEHQIRSQIERYKENARSWKEQAESKDASNTEAIKRCQENETHELETANELAKELEEIHRRNTELIAQFLEVEKSIYSLSLTRLLFHLLYAKNANLGETIDWNRAAFEAILREHNHLAVRQEIKLNQTTWTSLNNRFEAIEEALLRELSSISKESMKGNKKTLAQFREFLERSMKTFEYLKPVNRPPTKPDEKSKWYVLDKEIRSENLREFIGNKIDRYLNVISNLKAKLDSKS